VDLGSHFARGFLFVSFSLLLKKQEVCHRVALPFTLKSILTQKKNFENPLEQIKILQDDHNFYN
jgi:hypothetical protein